MNRNRQVDFIQLLFFFFHKAVYKHWKLCNTYYMMAKQNIF